MSTLHEAIRAQLDNYATGDPSDGDHGDFQRDHAAPELFAAVRNILDYADGLGEPFAGSTYYFVAAALGVAEPAQPPVPAQAEPRVWRVGDRVQWLRYSDDTITDTGTVVERDTQQWPGHVPVLPDYYRDGPHPMTHPVYIAPEHLSEVTDQAGEA